MYMLCIGFPMFRVFL